MTTPQLLTVDDVAPLLHVSRYTAYRLAAVRKPSCPKNARIRRFSQDEFEEYL